MAAKLYAALALAARGFRVFPLQPGGKLPAAKVSERFYDIATTDPAQITEWWTQQDYNVGVSTTGLVVVDLDMKRGKDGVGSYALLGGDYNTFVVRTPTGGYHCYFNGPDAALDVEVAPGVDIRGWHGYVVGPGSSVRAGDYEIAVDKPLADVPVGVECILKPPRQPRIRGVEDVELDLPASIANAAVWLDTVEPAIEGQGGDNKTYQVAAKLLRDYALSEEQALYLLAERWNPRCLPPWPLDELYRKVENAQSYATGDLGQALPSVTFNGVQVVEPAPPPPPAAIGLAMGNAMDPLSLTQRPFLVRRLLLRGHVTMLVAPGGGGKSTLTLTACAHFAAGRDFGAYALVAPGKPLRCIVYNAEEDLPEQTRRLLALCSVYNLPYEEVRQNIMLVTKEHVKAAGVGNHGINVATGMMGRVEFEQPTIDFIKALIRQSGADICVLEPLINLHTVDENNNPMMKKVMTVFEDIAGECNVPVWITHHTPKGGDAASRAGNADAGRGASAISGAARVNLTMTGATPQDCQKYGIRENDKNKFLRVDAAKANYFAVGDEQSVWLRWQDITLQTTDRVGVLVLTPMNEKEGEQLQRMARILYDAIHAADSAHIRLSDGVTALRANEPLYERMHVNTLRDKLKLKFHNPVRVDGTEESIQVESDGANVIVKIV